MNDQHLKKSVHPIALMLLVLVSWSLMGCSDKQAPSKISQSGDITFSSPTAIIIANATVIDPLDGSKRLADIELDGDRIVRVIARTESLAGALPSVSSHPRIIDATGQYAIPGLWDMHVHLTYYRDLEERVGPLFIANGITGVRDLGGSNMNRMLALREQSRDANHISPRIKIVGPLLDSRPSYWAGDHTSNAGDPIGVAFNDRASASKAIDQLIAQQVDGLKPYDNLEPSVFSLIASKARQKGLTVDGHVPDRVPVKDAIEQGMQGIQHLSGLQIGCSQNPDQYLSAINKLVQRYRNGTIEESAIIGEAWQIKLKALQSQDPARCQQLIKQFVRHNTWHTPTLIMLARQSLFPGVAPWGDTHQYLPPSVREPIQESYQAHTPTDSDKRNSERVGQWALATTAELHKAGVKLLAGSDTPSGWWAAPGFGLHDELAVLVKAGLSPLAALQTATLNPALFMDEQDQLGRIKAGYKADIVLLNANPLEDIQHTRQIEVVISKGRVFDRADLDAMLGAMVSKVKN